MRAFARLCQALDGHPVTQAETSLSAPLHNSLLKEEEAEANRSDLPKVTPSHGYDLPLSLVCVLQTK